MDINDRVNHYVEGVIANNRNNLTATEIAGFRAVQDLEYYQKYGAKEEAIRRLFVDDAPDGRFCSDYDLNALQEAAFIAWLHDPEDFIQTEAEQYIKSHQEVFLLEFLKNDALLDAYHALMQDVDNPIHRMKAITDAVEGCGAKTVTVTVQKDGEELTFKAEASSLTGYKNSYSTFYINGGVCDPYGDLVYVNESYHVNRMPPAIICTQQDELCQRAEPPSKILAKLLKWIVHTLEIYWWEQDFCSSDDDEPEDVEAPLWSVHVEYSNGDVQDMKSADDLPDHVLELLSVLSEFFD